MIQVKIVQLVKSQDTLTGERNAEPIVGATIKVVDILILSLYLFICVFVFVIVVFVFNQAEDNTGRILIARVMHGGAADRSGLIAVGDEVMMILVIMVMMPKVMITS